MKEINYKLFLTYDELSFEGIEYGIINLAYIITSDFRTLFIQKSDTKNNSIKTFEIPLSKIYDNDKSVLEDFLIDLMAYNGNFCGHPIYESSEIFSEEEFNLIREKGNEIILIKKELAIKENLENELIKYCLSKNLNPQPEGSSGTNWISQCPSGGKHHIFISTKSNQWGCGYCKKKGDLMDLIIWVENKRNIT